MPKRNDVETSQGRAIIKTLREILERCEKAGARLAYPGEGGERRFRGWLVSDLLAKTLGWHTDNIIVGERFDILLRDAEGFPVVTIETKTPFHKASAKERMDFEERLAGFGTLRTAYFTNGAEWEQLEILAPTGVQEIQARSILRIEDATDEETEAFFAPLAAARYINDAPRLARHSVRREHTHILAQLAADLDNAVADIAAFLEILLKGLRENKAGVRAREVTLGLFDLWCEKSLVVSPRQAGGRLAESFRKDGFQARELPKLLADLGLTEREMIERATDALSSLSDLERRDATKIADALWSAYENTRRKLCAQTAHVLIARALLYRIGEDQKVFPRLLSGEEMERALSAPPSIVDAPPPATELLARVRVSMHEFLPAVYELGEFDWWLVKPDDRAVLRPTERAYLRAQDEEFERALKRLLRMLDGYSFAGVDVDVWRNVYQHYLPAEERQRLGGFYTPDELVNLTLDLAGFTSETEGICQLSFIDPACGSGAFATTALARLLKHLELKKACHAEINKRGVPEWRRSEEMLKIATRNLHAIDLHPFAAFLTTLNALFLLMPHYVKAREKNPTFSLDLQIFSADALEKPHEERIKPDLFASVNSRIQLTEESLRRYQRMMQVRFDRVFGNPPWGGVLKGHLAPVYDTQKKQRLTHEFPAAARGKYDVYGLFMERALQILDAAGRFAFVTQGSFIDKEWAAGLREKLAREARLRFVVDLNPFGQLFFKAMNIPCITVADNAPPKRTREAQANGDDEAATDGECIAVLSRPPEDFRALDEAERRRRVEETIKEAIAMVGGQRTSATVGFAHAARVSLRRLRETARDRWNLTADAEAKQATGKDWVTAADVLEPFQGVTVGGENCLDIFLLARDEAVRRELETELVHPVIKGRETTRWRTPELDHAIFYPYDVTEGTSQPAFAIELAEVENKQTRVALKRMGLSDALDFDHALDAREGEIARRKGVNRGTVAELLRHRIGLELVRFPHAAAYLIEHYEQLEGRILKKRNIREFNRRWYEFIWMRDPSVMLARPKIITPRLSKEVRFALDKQGIVPQDSCIGMLPTQKTERGYRRLREQLAAATGKRATLEDVLKYCLAFLNSDYAQHRFVTGRRPTPKGSYTMTEAALREIPIPPPGAQTASEILRLVTQLTKAKTAAATSKLEKELARITGALLKA